jgi:histidinol dehydrogenase
MIELMVIIRQEVNMQWAIAGLAISAMINASFQRFSDFFILICGRDARAPRGKPHHDTAPIAPSCARLPVDWFVLWLILERIMKMKRIDDKTQRKEILALFAARNEDAVAVREVCAGIIKQVRDEGDKALVHLSEKYDHVKLDDGLAVGEDMIDQAASEIDPELRSAMELAIDRIKRFHCSAKPRSFDLDEEGGRVSLLWKPMKCAGIYAPGGVAPLFSTLLMCAVPALVAGCEEIVVCTPPQKDLNGGVNVAILAACRLLGLSNVYRIGGAQAIAAMAYGTETIPQVDVIVGPGNTYVTEAKRLVQGDVRIDSLAGPSEVLIIADSSANPTYIAADLLSQAEHAGDNGCVVVSNDSQLLDGVESEVERQLQELSRQSLARRSIEAYGLAIQTETLEQAFELSDEFAPEHLELMLEEPRSWLDKVNNAGAVFLGPWTPEPLGDYLAGPNHVLPTNGTARFSGPLSTDDFMKKISVLEFWQNGFESLAKPTIRMAMEEGLDAHANSIRVRREKRPS